MFVAPTGRDNKAQGKLAQPWVEERRFFAERDKPCKGGARDRSQPPLSRPFRACGRVCVLALVTQGCVATLLTLGFVVPPRWGCLETGNWSGGCVARGGCGGHSARPFGS